MMNETIQRTGAQALEAIAVANYNGAIAAYSDTISIVEQTASDNDMAKLLGQRAACFLLAKKFEGNADVYDQLEKTIPTPWLNLGHATVKFVTTMLVGVAAGLLGSIFSDYSKWKLAILAMIFCLVALFLNFSRLFQIFNLHIGAFQFDYIWRFFRRETSVIPSIQTTTQRSGGQQANSNRF